MLLDGFVGSGVVVSWRVAVVCSCAGGVYGRGERRGGTHHVSQCAMVNWEKGAWDTRLRRRFDFEIHVDCGQFGGRSFGAHTLR